MTGEAEPEKSFLLRVQLFLAEARFFTFSALVHFIIVLVGGSVILYSRSEPDFANGDGGERINVSAEVSAQPPEDDPLETSMEMPSPEVAPATINAVTTESSAPSPFTIAAPSMPQITTNIDPSKMGQGLAGKAGAGGRGGIPGGTAGTRFGSKEVVNGLVGTFYDTKQTKSKRPTNNTVQEYASVMQKFVRDGWKESTLSGFFKSPAPLYTTQLFIPNMPADNGPKAFDMDKIVQPSRWLIHYVGKVIPPRDTTFRFVGAGDDYLVVRFNGKVVLDQGFFKSTDWQPEKYYHYETMPKEFARGDEIRVKGGQSYDMEVLIGEQPGGFVFFCLMIEEQGQEYAKDSRGNPILPVFRLADTAQPPLKSGEQLPPYAPDGPVWKAVSPRGSGSSMSPFFKSL